MSHIRTCIGAVTALAMSALLTATGPASAEKVGGGTFHDEGSFTLTNFCGAAGLTVDGHFTVDGRFLGRLQGPGSIYYEIDHTRVVTVFTREGTGQTVTDIQPQNVDKDLSVTDNGDGTITLIELVTGGERTYGDEGRLIASNSGQVRFRLLIDDGDTPSDPSDDAVLSSDLIFGSTGTNQDFCSAVLTNWGVSS